MWLIEDLVFPRDEELALRKSLLDAGVDHKIFTNADLKRNGIQYAEDDVPRGSCWWISQLATSEHWNADLWGTIENFAFSRYAGRFGKLLLNDQFELLSFHELCWRGVGGASTASLFVRPDDGFKSFEGQLVCSGDFDDWVNRTQLLQVRGSLPVIVAPPQELHAEWRMVLVDGVVAACSRYRPSVSDDVPGSVIAFATLAHRTAAPACRCYVMDIAECSQGLRVVEIGSVNCVAFYASDPRDIVRAITSL